MKKILWVLSWVIAGLAILVLGISYNSLKEQNKELAQRLSQRSLGMAESYFNRINPSDSVATSTYTGSGGLPLLALARNDLRNYALIQNDGTADVYIYLNNFASDVAASTTVLANTGFRLVPGGHYEILPENLYTGDIWVATTSIAQRLLITEKL